MQKNEERTNFENLEIVLLVIVVAIQQLSVGLETYWKLIKNARNIDFSEHSVRVQLTLSQEFWWLKVWFSAFEI